MLISSDKKAFHFATQLVAGEGYELLRALSQDNPVDVVMSLKPALVLLHLDDLKRDSLAVLSRIVVKTGIPIVILYNGDEKSVVLMKRGFRLGAADALKIPDNISTTLESRVLKDRMLRVISEAAARYDGNGSSNKEKQLATVHNIADIRAGLRKSEKAKILGIAISTGGPNALSKLLPGFPADFPIPIVVVQHIIPGFITNVAARLNNASTLNIKIAEEGEELLRGNIYFAPDGKHLVVQKNGGALISTLSETPDNLLFRPSADVLFESIVKACGAACVGVIMTGMGRDGVSGMKLIRNAGGVTVVQNQQSSAIYGMGRVAVEENIVDHVLGLEEMPKELYRLVSGSGTIRETADT